MSNSKTSTTTTKFIQVLGKSHLFRSIFGALLSIGLPVNIFFVLFFYSSGWQASTELITVIFFAAQWSWIGPLLIWYFETRLCPNFWQSIKIQKIIDGVTVDRLRAHYTCISVGGRKIVIYLWAVFLVFAFILTTPFMRDIGMPQMPNVWFWLWCLGTFLSGILTGQGFAGLIMMVRSVHSCTKYPLVLDQYHEDGLGGLSSFGTFAIGTTVLFSSGSVFLPILMKVGKHSELGPQIVYGLIGLYIFAIAVCFLLPTFLVCRKAKTIKEDMLRQVSKCIVRKDQYDKSKGMEAIYYRNYFLDIKLMGIYPFNTWVLGKLIGSLGFPILVVYIAKLLGIN